MTNDNFTNELEMLQSQLTVLQKGRHEDDPESDAKIKVCQARIVELKAGSMERNTTSKPAGM